MKSADQDSNDNLSARTNKLKNLSQGKSHLAGFLARKGGERRKSIFRLSSLVSKAFEQHHANKRDIAFRHLGKRTWVCNLGLNFGLMRSIQASRQASRPQSRLKSSAAARFLSRSRSRGAGSTRSNSSGKPRSRSVVQRSKKIKGLGLAVLENAGARPKNTDFGIISPLEVQQIHPDTPDILVVGETPRIHYDRELRFKAHECVSAFLQLSEKHLNALESEFASKKVDRRRFVDLIQNTLEKIGGTSIDTSGLCQVFRDIDVADRGAFTWDDFTEHLVELVHRLTEHHVVKRVQRYWPAEEEYEVPDQMQAKLPLEFCKYFKELDRIIVFQRGSPVFKVYFKNLKLQMDVRGHRGNMITAIYQSEHQQLITSSADLTVTFWSTKPNEYFTMVKQWDMSKPQMALESDSATLYSSNLGGKIVSWSIERGESKGVFTGHSDIVMALCLIPNSTTLVSASMDTTIRCWHTITGEEMVLMRGHQRAVASLAWSAEDQLLVSAGLDPYALVWELNVAGAIYKIEGTAGTYLVGISVVAGTSEVLLADSVGLFRLFDLSNMEVIQSFQAQVPPTSFTVVYPSGALVACCRSLKKYNRCVERERTHIQAVQFAQFNPHSLTFLTIGGACAKVWNALTGRKLREYACLTPGGEPITAACLDHTMQRFIIGCHSGRIAIHNYTNGLLLGLLTPHGAEVSDLLYYTERKEIFSISWEGSLTNHIDEVLSPLSNSSVNFQHTDHKKDCTCLALSSELGLVATGGSDGVVSIHFLRSLGTPAIKCFGQNGQVTSLAFLNPYPLLVASDETGQLVIWHTPLVHDSTMYMKVISFYCTTPESRSEIVECLSFHPKTAVLYAGTTSGNLCSWDLTKVFRQLSEGEPGEKRPISDPGVSRRGTYKTLARAKTSGFEASPPQKALFYVEGAHSDSVRGIQYIDVPNQDALMSWGYDGCVFLWNCRTSASLGILCPGDDIRPEGERNPDWKFVPDIDKHRQMVEAEAMSVKAFVRSRRNKAMRRTVMERTPSELEVERRGRGRGRG
eukprot:979652_1